MVNIDLPFWLENVTYLTLLGTVFLIIVYIAFRLLQNKEDNVKLPGTAFTITILAIVIVIVWSIVFLMISNEGVSIVTRVGYTIAGVVIGIIILVVSLMASDRKFTRLWAIFLILASGFFTAYSAFGSEVRGTTIYLLFGIFAGMVVISSILDTLFPTNEAHTSDSRELGPNND